MMAENKHMRVNAVKAREDVHIEFYGVFVLRARKSPAGSVTRSRSDKNCARSKNNAGKYVAPLSFYIFINAGRLAELWRGFRACRH